MRLTLTLLALATIAPAFLADDKDAKLVSPVEAAKMLDKKVTIEMEVKSAGKGRGVYFLNSEEDYKSEKNFTIFINEDVAKKYKDAKIEDPSAEYKGKVIRVTGTVKLYKEKPEIVIDDPKQIEVVEKKKEPATDK
jgi:DNA/RNA endonuclease YhcR with UshA esterase domain